MSYETLRLIWWALLGVLLIGFAITDGYDLGTAALLPFVARNNAERRVAINTVGPLWEGNQVWFVLGGGAIFAAWPPLYAAAFSGFYLAMLMVLLTLILRAAAFKFRGKIENALWQNLWDWCLFAGGVVPALVFGVAFGNLFKGVPFSFDPDLHFISAIPLLSLFTPFTLLAGLTSVAMIVLHGAAWLNLRASGAVAQRSARAMPYAAAAFALLFAAAGFLLINMNGLRITSLINPAGPSNPLLKAVAVVPGLWLSNFTRHGWFWLLPIAAFVFAWAAVATRRWPLIAMIATSLVEACTIATAGVALFPFLLTSSTNPDMSLTVWDASSSKLTLEIMLGSVALFLPIVLGYTIWAHHVFSGRMTAERIAGDSHNYD